MKISDFPFMEERPRERLLRHGAMTLSHAELLAIVLRTGTRGVHAIALSNQLLQSFGGLRNLLGTSATALQAISGLGQAKACSLAVVLELARRSVEEDMKHGQALHLPEYVKQYCQIALSHQTVEHCIALYLDNQLRLIACGELARGTLSQASIYPREVVREALRHHCAALIVAHNHPSGFPQPSASDLAFTQHLKQALALVDIRLVDHLVVAGNVVCSMAEQGQL